MKCVLDMIDRSACLQVRAFPPLSPRAPPEENADREDAACGLSIRVPMSAPHRDSAWQGVDEREGPPGGVGGGGGKKKNKNGWGGVKYSATDICRQTGNSRVPQIN